MRSICSSLLLCLLPNIRLPVSAVGSKGTATPGSKCAQPDTCTRVEQVMTEDAFACNSLLQITLMLVADVVAYKTWHYVCGKLT